MADEFPADQPRQLWTRSRGSYNSNIREVPLQYHLALNRFVVSNRVNFLLDHYLLVQRPCLCKESNLYEKSGIRDFIIWANGNSEALLPVETVGVLSSPVQMSILKNLFNIG